MDGIVVTDKPGGKTSCWAVSRVKKILGEQKAGHAGTLDPLATGVLVLGLGFATRVLRYVESFDKEYKGVVQLGVTTETDDAEGRITGILEVPVVSPEQWETTLRSFTGKLSQTPPCYSAIKISGERAYTKARRGETFDIRPREVTVHQLDLLSWDAEKGCAEIRVRCSKGTYIRSLARDIGKALGCGGHLIGLCRERIGPFTLSQAVTLDDSVTADKIRAAMLPLEAALSGLPGLTTDADQEARLLRGQPVRLESQPLDGSSEMLVRKAGGEPLCLGRVETNETGAFVWPIRMLKGI